MTAWFNIQPGRQRSVDVFAPQVGSANRLPTFKLYGLRVQGFLLLGVFSWLMLQLDAPIDLQSSL